MRTPPDLSVDAHRGREGAPNGPRREKGLSLENGGVRMFSWYRKGRGRQSPLKRKKEFCPGKRRKTMTLSPDRGGFS